MPIVRDEKNDAGADERGANRCQDNETKIRARFDWTVMALDRARILGADRSGRDQFRKLATKPANRPPIDGSGHGRIQSEPVVWQKGNYRQVLRLPRATRAIPPTRQIPLTTGGKLIP